MENKKDTKTIAISKEVWLRLSKAKLNWGFDSFDTLISWVLREYESKINQEK